MDYDGVVYRILELYGCTKTPNEGVKWTPDQIFSEISRIEEEHRWLKGKKIIGIADPSIWDASRGESVRNVRLNIRYIFLLVIMSAFRDGCRYITDLLLMRMAFR